MRNLTPQLATLVVAVMCCGCSHSASTTAAAISMERPLRMESRAGVVLIGETAVPPKLALRCSYEQVVGSVSRVSGDTVHLRAILERRATAGTPRRCAEVFSGAVIVSGSAMRMSQRRFSVLRTLGLSIVGGLAFLLWVYTGGAANDLLVSTDSALPHTILRHPFHG